MEAALRGAAGILLATLPFAILGVYAARRYSRGPFDREDGIAVGAVAGLAAFLFQAQVMGRFNAIKDGVTWIVAGGAALAAVAVTIWIARVLRRSQTEPPKGITAWRIVAILAVVVGAAAPFVVQILQSAAALPSPTPWYYWNLALQAADAGGLPATSIEWGQEVAFLADYPAFTSATAATIDLIGASELQAAHLMRVGATLATGLGFYALARAWCATRVSALAGIFGLLAIDVYVVKLASYRPEAFGYGLMLLAPALFKRYLDTGNRAFAAVSGIGLLALSQVHGLTFTVSGILLIATAIVAFTARPNTTTLKEAAIGGATVAGLWAVGELLLRGRLTDVGKLQTAPTIGPDGIDPTWVFASFDTKRELLDSPAMSELVSDSLDRGFAGLSLSWYIAATIVVLGLLVYHTVRRHPQGQQILALVLLVLVGALIFSAVWFIGWETYVPRRTGAGRVVQLTAVLVPLGGAVAVSTIAQLRLRDIATTVFVTLCIVAWLAGIPRLAKVSEVQRPGDVTIALQQTIDLAPGLALSNAYTEGYLPAILGVDGLLDGRAPYTEADLLERSNRLRQEARTFFASPEVDGFDFDGYGVDYLIVSPHPWTLGTSRIFDVDLTALNKLPNLELLIREGGYRVYRVKKSLDT